jgi:deoxycytidine triphosphate deaminase
MSVLAKSEILRRLEEGKIFMAESWDAGCLRSAAYNLRVATDYLIAPSGTRYWPDGPPGQTECVAPFSLAPGEVAFVSTVERLCLPFDVAGNIAQKFSVTRNGILVLGGLLVDPGYGCELRKDGKWWVKENGQRLHFQLVNVGDREFAIAPGKTSVAGIQFMTLDGFVMTAGETESDVMVPNSDDLLEDLFGKGDARPLAPLAFFPRMADLREDLDRASSRIEKQKIKLDSTKRSTDQLVVFGVFLLAITLFTVACAALIDAIATGTPEKAKGALKNTNVGDALSHEGVIVAVAVTAVVLAFCLTATATGFGVLRLRQRGREKKASKTGAEGA